MRLAYVCADPGVPVFGSKGCSIHVQEVIRGLTARGVNIDLFTPRFGGDVPTDLAGVRCHQLPRIPKGDLAQREQSALQANAELQAALDREGPFDAVYERYSLWSDAGIGYAKACGIPGLLEVNAPLIEEQVRHRDLIDRASADRVAKYLFRTATTLITVSSEVAQYVRAFTEADDHVHVVSNGVDPDRFSPDVLPARQRVPDTFTVGFVGTLKPWHGVSILIDAFDRLHASFPGARLLIVGDGPERENLLADLSSRRSSMADAVVFTGAVAPDEVPAWLTSMDVAVAPYPDLDQFYFSPLKVFEYMAAALPVVASEIGQLTSVIENGVNGRLYPPGDVTALAQILDELCRSPQKNDRMGRAARETVIREQTWEGTVQQILEAAKLEHRLPALSTERGD